MPAKKHIEWLRDRECAVALDPRHHPILISTWQGVPTTTLVDRYFCWSDAHAAAALAAEERLVHIVDLSQTIAPPAHVRRRVYDHAAADLIREVTMCSIVVTEDPMLRRIVVTAHAAVPGLRPPDVLIVDAIEVAIVEAHARLRAACIPPPNGLDPRRYQPPTTPL